MSPDDLATILTPIQDVGIEVMATAAAAMIASTISAYRHLGEAHQERMIALIVTEAWRLYDAAVAEETRIRAALVPDTSGRMH